MASKTSKRRLSNRRAGGFAHRCGSVRCGGGSYCGRASRPASSRCGWGLSRAETARLQPAATSPLGGASRLTSDRLESLSHRRWVEDRLESLPHQRREEGRLEGPAMLTRSGEARTSMRKSELRAERGAWALARFLRRQQLPGEKEKNALAGARLQLLVPQPRRGNALPSPGKAFFSFSPAFGTRGAQKRARAHAPKSIWSQTTGFLHSLRHEWLAD